ncbi:unnamed protein product [Blepharisma stoltei]|uniref:Hexose transporter 1 n=1 Tax=Blepharisma stoltei TaxID=1481888 RepID=A0AAU9J4Z5_9CILI|nr:unnamed protein product [Blepharisma stoltei]
MKENLLDGQEYELKKVIGISFTASIGSFLFGYNIGVFNSMQPNVSASLDWGGDEKLYISIISTLMPFGALFGAIYGGQAAEKLGRRKSMIFSDILVIIGSLIFIFPSTTTLGVGRFFTGFTSGMFSVICPVYISEFSPTKISGKIGSLVQIMINLGVLFAFAIALLLPTEDFDKNSFNWWWLFMLSLQGLFALLQLLLFFVWLRHETPYWLLKFNKNEEALKSL